MDVTYGQGFYIEGNQKSEGQIILSDHKVFLRYGHEDIARTFIPLEKIERIQLKSNQLTLSVRPAIMSRYQAIIESDKKNVHSLALEIASRRGLKKQFLKKEWFEESY